MQVRLTDSVITAATRKLPKGERVELADTLLPGLRLRIAGGGKRTWVLGCRDADGRARRFPLGDYPATGVSAARDAARLARQSVKQGADPIKAARARRKQAKDATAGVGTFRTLLDRYTLTEASAQKSWAKAKPRIERVLAGLLDKPAAALTVRDLQEALDSYRAPKEAAFAKRSVRKMLNWASAPGRELMSADLTKAAAPATGATPPRKRVLDRAELARLLPVLRASASPYAAAMRIMLLTLVRVGEATGARWRDVDLSAATWTLPRTKNGQVHIVPLSRQAVALLRERAPAAADPDAFVFASDAGTELRNWDRIAKRIQADSGTVGWHRHDLRRTGATMLGELPDPAVLPDIIEAALNHTAIRSALAATYNRSRYRPQVAAALQRLADELDIIDRGAEATGATTGVVAEQAAAAQVAVRRGGGAALLAG